MSTVEGTTSGKDVEAGDVTSTPSHTEDSGCCEAVETAESADNTGCCACACVCRFLVGLFLLPFIIVFGLVAVIVWIILLPLKCCSPCCLPCWTAISDLFRAIAKLPVKAMKWVCKGSTEDEDETKLVKHENESKPSYGTEGEKSTK